MHRNFQPSKETEDKVKLAKQYIECTIIQIQLNINLSFSNNTCKKLLGRKSRKLWIRPLSLSLKKKLLLRKLWQSRPLRPDCKG